ncbi:MAG: dephospho-CoA kinase [Ktedonobacterales bacterium]|nr:dephospho-CoA kinase [Ktedonobacterales bacterium]
MAYFLGLTGNIASGKTTIGLMLLELGASVYCDADLVVHELYLPGQSLVEPLVQTFGPAIRDADGGIDRRALGRLVFGDPAQLHRLEALVHPAVRAELLRRMRVVPADGVGVLDAVKLVESGYSAFAHGLWIVTCPRQEQVRRLIELRGLSAAEAAERLAAQPPLEPKLALASEVIDNSGSLDDLRRQVTVAWERFQASLARERGAP